MEKSLADDSTNLVTTNTQNSSVNRVDEGQHHLRRRNYNNQQKQVNQSTNGQHQRNFYFYSRNYQRKASNIHKGKVRRKSESTDEPSSNKEDVDKVNSITALKTLEHLHEEPEEQSNEICDDNSPKSEQKANTKKLQQLHDQSQNPRHKNFNNARRVHQGYSRQHLVQYAAYNYHQLRFNNNNGQGEHFRLSNDLREQRQRFYHNRYVSSSSYNRANRTNYSGDQSTNVTESTVESSTKKTDPNNCQDDNINNDSKTQDEGTTESGKNKNFQSKNVHHREAFRFVPHHRHYGHRRQYDNGHTKQYHHGSTENSVDTDFKGYLNSNRRYRRPHHRQRQLHQRSINSTDEASSKISSQKQKESTRGGKANVNAHNESECNDEKANGQVENVEEEEGEEGIALEDGESSSDDDSIEKDCPLCLELLDTVESKFYPCSSCKFQICLFCLNRLKEECISAESESTIHSCPGCRNPYPNNVDDESVFLELSQKLTQKSNQNGTNVTNGTTSKSGEKHVTTKSTANVKNTNCNRYSNLTCDTGDAYSPEKASSHGKKSSFKTNNNSNNQQSNQKQQQQQQQQQVTTNENRSSKNKTAYVESTTSKNDLNPKKMIQGRTNNHTFKDARGTSRFIPKSNIDSNSNEKYKKYLQVNSKNHNKNSGELDGEKVRKNKRTIENVKGKHGNHKSTVQSSKNEDDDNGLYYEQEPGKKQDLVDLLSNIGLDPSRIHFHCTQKCETD